MTRFDDLDRALSAYFDIEAAAPAPAGLLESAMTTTSRHRPRRAPLARLHARGNPSARGETTRTLLIAAALAALLLVIVGLALIGGGRDRSTLLGDATATPPPAESTPPSETPITSGPADDALRATWLADTRELPLLGTGSGPVSMTISANGTSLSAANFAPGATFDSSVSQLGNGTIKLALDRASGGCNAGAIGTYTWHLSDDGSLLTTSSDNDECATRAEALSRSWGRSLVDPTSRGSGFVTSMTPAFSVRLPDQVFSSRTLDDFIEIGGENGFSLTAFKNPQGFVDACSTDEQRVPFAPGAKAFADFMEHNRSLTLISRENVTVDGLPAIHIVTDVNRTASAPCAEPSTGLYLWTPKDCNCHFVGGQDSLYIVDLPSGDTMMFEVSPVDATNPIERQVIDSMVIPAAVPAG
jgi:hypothetical protein